MSLQEYAQQCAESTGLDLSMWQSWWTADRAELTDTAAIEQMITDLECELRERSANFQNWLKEN